MARVRAPFVITVAAVAATLPSCGGSTDNDGGAGSGAVAGVGGSGGSGGGTGGEGNVSGSGAAPGCPASFPSNGDSCSLPSGTSCFFDQGQCCPDWEARCVSSKWEAYPSSCNPPAPDPCPQAPPQDGTSCGSSDPCGNTYNYCTYDKCEDGSPRTIAECQGGTWQVSQANCIPAKCEGLTPCECFARSDCQAKTDTCICPCDYMCPGTEPCACDCGGGQYLGCVPL